MRQSCVSVALAAVVAVLLSACGGGGGSGSSSSSSGGSTNQAPTANAGASVTVVAGNRVYLNGSASSDRDGTVASYFWTQTAGDAVTLSSSRIAQPEFDAPAVNSRTTLTFSLVVADDRGTNSAPATVNVIVNPVLVGTNVISGTVRFERVGFSTDAPRPLDYANPVPLPARGVIVRAVRASNQDELDSTSTDANGHYELTMPSGETIFLEVVAHMKKTGVAPTWDVRVQNGVPGNNPFVHRAANIGTTSGFSTVDIDIPLGLSATGNPTGIRASAAFAILDTIYTAQQVITDVSPLINFPELIVDWGSQSDGTFFTPAGGQHIALLSDPTEDTDEFDQHVIAHEFGHYLEHNFSRADSIGGAHGLGDRLDPRVAFGEGFGYAFAAIVLNDPNARDSFFGDVTNDSVNNPVHRSGGFNIETNPSTGAPGVSPDREGCWCSESSVWSILYDIYDSAADSNDTLALGLQPIWDVLVGEQRTTPAFTTIFSFISALKAARPGNATAINTLVAAQNIDATNITPFASGETHFPNSGTPMVPQAAALPLYTLVALGSGPVTLRNVNDAGLYNKLGNHRWVRFNVPTTRNVTITLATSNATDNDPDYLLFGPGNFFDSSTAPPPGPETNTFNLAAGDYLLDIYDCANGCSTEQGTSGDFDLTLTIN